MPKRVDHEERRRAIADALLRVARSAGLHTVGMREVAAEAGVSVRLVQYYFGTKEQLLLGGLHRVSELMGERLGEKLAELPSHTHPRRRIETILTVMLPTDELTRELYAIHSAYAALALTEPSLAAQPFGAGMANLQAEIVRLLASAQQAAHLSADIDPDTTAFGLVAMTTGLAAAITARYQDPPTAAAALSAYLDLIFPESIAHHSGRNPPVVP